MVHKRHIEKFVADNADQFKGRDVLSQLKLKTHNRKSGNLLSRETEELLGEQEAAQLFRLIETDGEYMRISLEEATAAS